MRIVAVVVHAIDELLSHVGVMYFIKTSVCTWFLCDNYTLLIETREKKREETSLYIYIFIKVISVLLLLLKLFTQFMILSESSP